MTTDQTIESLSKVTLTIPANWPDHPKVKVPKGVLRIDATYTAPKKQYKVKVVFAVSNRSISGVGSTLFEAASNMMRKASSPVGSCGGYGAKAFANHEAFLRQA